MGGFRARIPPRNGNMATMRPSLWNSLQLVYSRFERNLTCLVENSTFVNFEAAQLNGTNARVKQLIAEMTELKFFI